MATHSSRLLPGPQSQPTTSRTATEATLVTSQPVGTQSARPAPETADSGADALAVLRRLCPLTDVLDALGATPAELDAWIATGRTCQLYAHPAGTVLVDPAALLAAMTKQVAA